jgi:hypothetical protein
MDTSTQGEMIVIDGRPDRRPIALLQDLSPSDLVLVSCRIHGQEYYVPLDELFRHFEKGLMERIRMSTGERS